MRWICVVAALLTAACSGPAESPRSIVQRLSAPGDLVKFFSFPAQKSVQDPGTWGALLTDIESHLPSSYGNQYYDPNPAIHAHETTHGINAHIRNTYGKPGDNGFYVLKDRAIVLAEPAMQKSKVAQYVPASLQGSRFSLYITGQTAWDNEPLYVFDEWVAYTNDSAVGVELHTSGKWTYGWTDGVAGTLEFCAYGTATAMAIEKNDPGYFAKTPQFLEFFAWQLKRAMDIFRAGKDLKDFKYATQDAYYKELQNGSAAAPLRSFLAARFGTPFMEQVLGLSTAPPPTPDSGAPPPSPDGGVPGPDTGAPPPTPPSDGGVVPTIDTGTPSPDGSTPTIRPQIGPHGQSGLGGGCRLGGRDSGLRLPLLLLLGLFAISRRRGRGAPANGRPGPGGR